jgi:hypothetical protein
MITANNMVITDIHSIRSTFTEWTMLDIITISNSRIIVRLVITSLPWCCHCPRFSQAEDSSLSIPMALEAMEARTIITSSNSSSLNSLSKAGTGK